MFGPRPSSYSRFSAELFSDVSDDVLDGPNLVGCIIDGPNLIAFLIVDSRVAALVDDGTQFFRSLAGYFKRPHRTLSDSDEALTSVNTIDENERFLAVSVDADDVSVPFAQGSLLLGQG
jgi:hypothetical protein